MSQEAQEAQAVCERVVAQLMAADAMSQWLGIEVLEVKPGQALVRMTVRADMVNGFGVCHGGVSFSLADSAFAFASNGHGALAYSVDASMHFPVRIEVGDEIRAHAEELSAAGPLAHYQVRLSNQHETTVGLFRGTVFRTRTRHESAKLAAKDSETGRSS